MLKVVSSWIDKLLDKLKKKKMKQYLEVFDKVTYHKIKSVDVSGLKEYQIEKKKKKLEKEFSEEKYLTQEVGYSEISKA